MGKKIPKESLKETHWQYAHAKNPRGREGEREESWEQENGLLVFHSFRQTVLHVQINGVASPVLLSIMFFLVNTKWEGRG